MTDWSSGPELPALLEELRYQVLSDIAGLNPSPAEGEVHIYLRNMAKHIANSSDLMEPIHLGKELAGLVYCEKSRWDTNAYREKSGKLRYIISPAVPDSVFDEASNTILRKSRLRGYRLLMARVPIENMRLVTYLARHGGILYDILLTFRLEGSEVREQALGPGIVITSKSESDTEEIANLAKATFERSHLYADPKLPKSKTDFLYSNLARNQMKENSCFTMIAKRKDDILGFVICCQHGVGPSFRYAEVTLVAVRPEYRGMGIGRALVGSAVKRLDSSRVACVVASTQATNQQSAQMFEAMGFRLISGSATFHFWL